MLLRHLGLDNQANLIASAVYDIVKEGKHKTADLGGAFTADHDISKENADPPGKTSTTDFTKAIIDRIV